MLETMFEAFLLTSGLGTAVALLVFLVRPLTKKYFSAGWHYYIWILALALMLIPVKVDMHELRESQMVKTVSRWWSETERVVAGQVAAVKAVLYEQEVLTEQSESFEGDVSLEEGSEKSRYFVRPYVSNEAKRWGAPQHLLSASLQEKRAFEIKMENVIQKLAPFWFAVAAVLLFTKVFGYLLFWVKIHRSTVVLECPELSKYTRRKIQVRGGSSVKSPQLLGVFRPILLLPEQQMTPEQFENVLAHEMTHLRRKDMLVKWGVLLVKCIHWFNPVVYLVSRRIDLQCEVSCDLAVTKDMDEQAKKGYADTILYFLRGQDTKEYALSMGMAGTRGMLKERFVQIKRAKYLSRTTRIMAGAVTAVTLLLGVVCSANLMNQAFPYIGDLEISKYESCCEECGEVCLFGSRYIATRTLEWYSEGWHTRIVSGYVYVYECPGCENTWERLDDKVSGNIWEGKGEALWEKITASVRAMEANE